MLIYLAAVLTLTVARVHPILSVASALSACTAVFLFCSRDTFRTLLRYCTPLAIFILLFNFLFNHNGVTVLFCILDYPFTAEALAYSLFSALSFLAAIFWLSAFSEFIGSDRVYGLFSGVSKNLAVIFALTLRLLPKILEDGAELGLSKKGGGARQNRLASYMLDLSALFSGVLEDSFETAISMKARGALLPKCKRKRVRRLRLPDLVLVFLSAAAVCCYFIFRLHAYSFYPVFLFSVSGAGEETAWGFLAIFVFLPQIAVLSEGIRWKYIRSKI